MQPRNCPGAYQLPTIRRSHQYCSMTRTAPRWTSTSPSPSGRSARWRTASRRWRSRCTSRSPGGTTDSLWSSSTRPGARAPQVGTLPSNYILIGWNWETISTNERKRSRNVQRFSYFPTRQNSTEHLIESQNLISQCARLVCFLSDIWLVLRGKFRPNNWCFYSSSHSIQVKSL